MKNKVIPIILIIWSLLFLAFNLFYSNITTDILLESAIHGTYRRL